MITQKVLTIGEISELSLKLKSEGKAIAHCHGCFDLMHLGHIRHFQSAKKLADVLIVTLTQDRFINKGPGRPVFSELQRAEAIASLETVDFVAINHWATAEETIRLIRPNYYVKGPDYKDFSKDLTLNIQKELDAVKSVGGELVITEDEAFSSSKIINSHFSKLSENVQEFLNNFKSKYSVEQVLEYINKLSDLKVLVIGDTIIDEYHKCTPLGKSSKSPTISTIFREGNSYAGGILAIANHIHEYASNVHLVSLLGTENPQTNLIEKKLNTGISSKFFIRQNAPTNTKRRYIDTYLNLKLFEVTFINDSPIDRVLEEEVISHLESVYSNYDLIILADFGHGFITPNIISSLQNSGKFLCVNAQTNSNNFGYNYITKYSKADYISIDEKELRLPFGEAYDKVESLISKLETICNARIIQITLGEKGSVIFDHDQYYYIPAFASSIKDSVGAGDAVLSITSLCTYNKVPSEIVGFIGNCMGAMAVNILGNEHPVYKKDLTKFISHFIK